MELLPNIYLINSMNLIHVKNQTDKICLAAVKKLGCMLEYVENQINHEKKERKLNEIKHNPEMLNDYVSFLLNL